MTLHEEAPVAAGYKQELVERAVAHVWRHGVPMQATSRNQGPVAVRAKGIQVWDIDGNCYLDALAGGSAAATLGHGREDVADAVAQQILDMQWVSLRTFINEPSVDLTTCPISVSRSNGRSSKDAVTLMLSLARASTLS